MLLVYRCYFTMLPLILSGILNMLFTKTKFYKSHKKPIDNYKKLKDGKRIFGDNKTWIGFISMILITILTQVCFGAFCNQFNLNNLNDFYNLHQNNLYNNLLYGFALGFMYMICELPNSFLKRRFSIEPSGHKKGIIGILFFLIDQFDSMIGTMLILYLVSDIAVLNLFLYILLGGITHLIINIILLLLKVRKSL